MSQRSITSVELAALLRRHQDKIITDWARKLSSFLGSHYQEYTLEENINWASQGLEVIIENINTGSDQKLETYITEIASARVQAGYPIYEVTEGFLLSKEAILPNISSSYRDDMPRFLDAVSQIDTNLRQMIVKFERMYSEAMHQQLTEESHKRLVESESLQRTTTALLQKLKLDEVLEIVCTEARQLTGATGSAVLLLENEGWFQVTISTGKPIPAFDRLPITESLAGNVVRYGNPCLVNDPSDQMHAYSRNPDLKALLVIPLCVEDTCIGVLDVVNKPGGFTDDDIRIMNLFADQAAIAIKNSRLHNQAEQLAVLEERQRLARELHDSVSQSLYSVSLYADAARLAIADGEIEETVNNIQELRNMAREAMLDMRLLIFELHPPILEEEGLTVALQTRLESVEARSGIKTVFEVKEDRRLPIHIESELYRIAQEALTNAVKHARAKVIQVQLHFSEKKFRMILWDNGIGFDPKNTSHGGGLGLRSMQQRIQRIDGTMVIDSKPGEGTAITIEVDI